jgi:hypothetical protein
MTHLTATVLLVLSATLAFGAEERPGNWAFKPASRPNVPKVARADWPRTMVDRFILSKLETNGLSPSPEADRRTLLRRVSFDLTGLPPSPEDVDAFVRTRDPLAYEKAVDRLLASPRYGERWARHWLDTVHFAETHGYDKDRVRTNAWPYRDYVIRSFNDDKPYSRFVQEQLAGDVLFTGDTNAIIALGFIAAGPWDHVGHVELPESKMDGLIARYNDRDDMLMTTMSTFQSLTVHCARCHDHKFDPISQEDYYRFQAVFAGVDRANRAYPLPNGGTGYVFAATAKFSGEGDFKPAPGPRVVHRLIRGDVKRPGKPMDPGALESFAELRTAFHVEDPADEGSRRAALANWITDKRNVNTRRSIVNRIWQYHFGRGIVDTPNDFGLMGGTPSHPELLDWLAQWFADNGESLKALHRLIVTSATYRQSSTNNPKHETVDAENRLLWRMNRNRLDADQIRDSILAISGDIDLRMGGPSARHFQYKHDHSPVYDHSRYDHDDAGNTRRSVYRFVVRSVPDPFMEALDCPDPSLLAPKRNVTTTSLQALAMLNDPFVARQADHFALRLEKLEAKPTQRINAAYRLAFGREPAKDERASAATYIEKHGLANFCRVLFNSNEFMFVD